MTILYIKDYRTDKNNELKCIYKRLKNCENRLLQRLKNNDIYGFKFVDAIFSEIETEFKTLESSRQDSLIMRTFDNIRRKGYGY